MVWGLSGQGLRTTISLEGYYIDVLANFLRIRIGNLDIPVGILLLVVVVGRSIAANPAMAGFLAKLKKKGA